MVGLVSDGLREVAGEDDEEYLSLGLALPPRPRPRLDISKNKSKLYLILSDMNSNKLQLIAREFVLFS